MFGGALFGFLVTTFVWAFNTPAAVALRDVSVTIPQAARIMDTVTLQCKYDLEGEQLYAVKWYKGSKEFYRFLPKELPNTQVFPLPGVDVDLSKSNANEVVLRHVQPDVTGRFKCEVSTDVPNFYTKMVSSYMYVIDVPEADPFINVKTDFPEIGYTIRGNCTSPPSFPPANITWLINGKKVNETYSSQYHQSNAVALSNDKRRQPLVTTSVLNHEIDGNTFQEGKARIQCMVNIFNLYQRVVEKVLEEDRPRPRPSSVLGTRESGAGSSELPGIVLMLLMVYATLLR